MRASITRQWPLPDIPSASGIEKTGSHYYIIGDDSPYLFVLNNSFQSAGKVALFKTAMGETRRIAKPEKPDLESLTIVASAKQVFLLAMGSGSIREKRDVAFLVEVPSMQVRPFPVLRFFDHLRMIFETQYASAINIEATVCYNDHLYLFQRGNITGINAIVCIPWNDFLHFEEHAHKAAVTIAIVSLPVWNGIQSGFSGACLIPDTDRVLFTASLEKTTNTIDDGPAGGSFTGLLHLNQPGKRVRDIVLLEMETSPYLGKVESITIDRQSNKNLVYATAVCDEDGNPSSLLQLEIEL